MQTVFCDVVEQVKALSFDEKTELKSLLENYLKKERRKEIYANYKKTKECENELVFSGDVNTLKKMLDKFILVSLEEWEGFEVNEEDDITENKDLMMFLSKKKSDDKKISLSELRKQLNLQ